MSNSVKYSEKNKTQEKFGKLWNKFLIKATYLHGNTIKIKKK